MNILTIDFDILTHIFEEERSQDRKDNNLKDFYPLDLELYKRLTKALIYFLGLHSNPQDLCFIEHHNFIIPWIEQNLQKEDLPINLINIDYHHDLSYGEEWNINFANAEENLNCGTWVRYLIEKNIVTDYTWVHGFNYFLTMPNSGAEEYCKSLISKELLVTEYDYEEIIFKVDKLIICHSEYWIPEYYDPLWQLWIELSSTIKNYNYSSLFEFSN